MWDIPKISPGGLGVTRVVVGRWGESLAVRIPGEIAEAAGLDNGEPVEIEAHDGNIVIRPAAPRFTPEELFRGQTAEQWQAEYSGAFDWGPEVGRERVEE